MLTKSMIALSAAIFLASAAPAPAMIHAKTGHHGPGFAQRNAPAIATARQALKSFTAEEKVMFDPGVKVVEPELTIAWRKSAAQHACRLAPTDYDIFVPARSRHAAEISLLPAPSAQRAPRRTERIRPREISRRSLKPRPRPGRPSSGGA
jgi:hypothetical protein